MNGRTVLLKVSGAGFTPFNAPAGSWIYVSGEAQDGFSATFDPAPQVVINHNLGRRPAAVTVRSLGGNELDCQVHCPNANMAVLYFDYPLAGTVEII